MTNIDSDLEDVRSKIARLEEELEQMKQMEPNNPRLATLDNRLLQLETKEVMLMTQKYGPVPQPGPGATPAAAGSGGLPEAVATLTQSMQQMGCELGNRLDKLDANMQQIKDPVVERMSQTITASNANPAQVQKVRNAAGCQIAYCGGPQVDADEPTTAPDVSDESCIRILRDARVDNSWRWDDRAEPDRAAEYVQHIGAKLTARGRYLHILDIKNRVVRGNLSVPVACKHDVLVSTRGASIHGMPEAGAVLGIEVKKDVSPAAIRQGEVEFYVFASTSKHPFVQVVTDLVRGGVVMYLDPELSDDGTGMQQLLSFVMEGMDNLWSFLNNMLSKLPPALLKNATCSLQQFEEPSRVTLKCARPKLEPVVTVAEIFAAAYGPEDEQDLSGFDVHDPQRVESSMRL